MSRSIEALKTELAELPVKDRAELAYFLIHSLDEDVEELNEDALVAELIRRTEEFKNDPSVGIPADQMFAELDQRFREYRKDSSVAEPGDKVLSELRKKYS